MFVCILDKEEGKGGGGMETKKKKEKVSFVFCLIKSEEKVSGINMKYELRATLGTGSFAVVKLGVNRSTGQHVAIKQIDKKKYQAKCKSDAPDGFKNEFEILRNINHKNIIKLYDVFETEETLYLVLEIASGGDLSQKIVQQKILSENIARKVMWQLLCGIKHLHDGKIAHRDVKPENVLLKDNDSWEIKITDFGLARVLNLDQGTLTTLCGTPLFLAPEILSSHKLGLFYIYIHICICICLLIYC
ncbi:protein kinase 1, partial [Reticulomyxa filosa]